MISPVSIPLFAMTLPSSPLSVESYASPARRFWTALAHHHTLRVMHVNSRGDCVAGLQFRSLMATVVPVALAIDLWIFGPLSTA